MPGATPGRNSSSLSPFATTFACAMRLRSKESMRLPRTVRLLSLLVAAGACSGTDTNRPDTYGSHCSHQSDCDAAFKCLGPADGDPAYWPICTVRCADASTCPRWNANGHCEGPITPVCMQGFCDYVRSTSWLPRDCTARRGSGRRAPPSHETPPAGRRSEPLCALGLQRLDAASDPRVQRGALVTLK